VAQPTVSYSEMLHRAMSYKILYADPPWQYNDSKGNDPKMGGITYDTMPTEKICELPVSGLAAKNAALFMWATWPMLEEAFKVIEAWGFQYKNAAFVWVKQNPRGSHPELFEVPAESRFNLYCGLGHYTRGNTEPCLLALRGSMERKDATVRQPIIHPVMKHSRKPSETRNRIVRLFGGLSRVELFAREAPKGWDVWGNEVDSTVNVAGSASAV